MTAYVVMGETGEYSDRHDWQVIAYLDDEASAQAHVVRAEEWLRVNRASMDGPPLLTYEDRHKLEGANPHDPEMPAPDYTGTRYYVMAVPIAKAEGTS